MHCAFLAATGRQFTQVWSFGKAQVIMLSWVPLPGLLLWFSALVRWY